MMHKTFTIVFVIVIAIKTFMVAGVNFIIDPFDVFHSNFLKYPFQMNERFIKVEFLEKNHHQFNSYMFGSSRMGSTHPEVIEKYVPNSKFYNFATSSANFSDYLSHLEYFLKRGYEIKNLYLQIDIMGGMTSYGQNEGYYLLKAHPYVTGDSLPSYYLKYLMNPSLPNIEGKILANTQDQNHSLYDFQTGSSSKEYLDEVLSSSCKEYIKNEPSFHIKPSRTITGDAISQSIDALRKIKTYCDQNHINLIIFITPHNQHMMDLFVVDDYLLFLEKIAGVVDYYDFSGYNSVTTNDCNYYEFSHYTPAVGKLIAAKIFNDHDVYIPSDFGIFVTKDTVQKHLKILRQQASNK